MPKNPLAKAKVTEADPFSSGFVDLSTESCREAVEEVWDRQKEKKQDSYGTIDGKLVTVKPDGRVESVTFREAEGFPYARCPITDPKAAWGERRVRIEGPPCCLRK